MNFDVTPVPAFSDNYIWLLHANGRAVVVDPGDANPVLRILSEKQLHLDAILITHHHGDHIGGINGLLREYPNAKIYGPALEKIPGITDKMGEGDECRLPSIGASFTVMDVPGHTAGHIAYYGHGMLFCGDTVFACGCGRVFGGTVEQLYKSLDRIAKLPADTLLYCAHEYTVDNIGFAKWVEPENPELEKRDEIDMQKQEQGIPTVPSSLALELKTNPFFRYHEPAVVAAAERFLGREHLSDAEVFAATRSWKDSEYD